MSYYFDQWHGYTFERDLLLEALGELARSAVVYAGDSHNAWAGLLQGSDGSAVASVW